MKSSEIKQLVSTMLSQAIAGADIESNKFDFKRQWYDLKSEADKAEFLKDTSSIANTYGPDGFIVIGFDNENKQFHPARFKDCNLRDTSELPALVNKAIDRLFEINTHDFEINGHSISVLHIPPSLSKPHVIRLHKVFKYGTHQRDEQQKIFVRKGSGTQAASKVSVRRTTSVDFAWASIHWAATLRVF